MLAASTTTVFSLTGGTFLLICIIFLAREVIRLRERIAWLEARVNGKPTGKG